MSKPKHSPATPADDADAEAAVHALTDLALACARGQAAADELARAVRRHLLHHEDDVLYDAVEQARGMADRTFPILRDAVEEAAANTLLRREGAPDAEASAFAIPVFVRSTGGLKAEEGFQDPAAYDALLASMTAAGLESPQAKVVLIQHWYDLAEIDRITYSRLHELLREVGAALGDKKVRPMPALEASMSGWKPMAFAAEDDAVELRFLLGFARKRADDKFYAVPRDEALADAYFEARMQRFRAWTEDAAPLVRRLLTPGGAGVEVNFLYQDLFFGARAQAVGELFVLQLLADVNAACAQAGVAPAQARAHARLEDDVLHVEVAGPDGGVLAAADKLLDPDADVAAEMADLDDALASLGLPPLEQA
ncbi:MAG: hypothetical protein ACXU8N_06050 [Telluria sp.]